MQPTSEPPFDFAHLVDVQPLLATASDGDFALTVDSIERYQHGFVLVMWVASGTGPLYAFGISARDDAGNSYVGRAVAGHGSGGEANGWVNRVVYAFSPELSMAARSLTLNLAHVRRVRRSPTGEHGMQHEDVTGGPWEFTFDTSQFLASEHEAATKSQTERQPIVDALVHTRSSLPSMAANSAFMYSGGSSPAEFRPQTLRRVIPVAQQQEVERFAFTLLSLESYVDGFIAVARTDCPERLLHLPRRFAWHAEDDCGGSYRA